MSSHFFILITQLNGKLDSCTFEVKEDGAYINYTLPGGADSVSKKLGSNYENFTFLQASGASGGIYDVKATSFTYTADEAMTVLALCISGGYNFTSAGSRSISSTGEKILRESRTTTNTAFLYAIYSLNKNDTITLFAQGNDWVHASSCILWKIA